jgi:1-pyrroline-5-carboxylate dehydrogenase
MPSEFKNEPLTNFDETHNATAFQKALGEVRATFGRTYPLWIDGHEIQTGQTFASYNPARPDEVLGIFAKADVAQADAAIEAAARAFETGSTTPPQERAELLFSAANRMRQRKHWFSAWLVYEVGKSWAEADADTAEAIDFMEFYGARCCATRPTSRSRDSGRETTSSSTSRSASAS